MVEHLLADLWVVLVKILYALPNTRSRVTDHPVRAEMEAKRRSAEKSVRIGELRALYEKRKRKYGLG